MNTGEIYDKKVFSNKILYFPKYKKSKSATNAEKCTHFDEDCN